MPRSRLTSANPPVALRKPTIAERRRLAKMVHQLFSHWRLDAASAAALLGLPSRARSTLSRYAAGAPLANQRDLLERVGNLLGIHKSLRLLFPQNRELVYRWMSTRNRALGDQRPVDIAREHGLPGLIALRAYLDHLQG